MAIGDQNDILTRLQGYLPPSWFDADSNPIRDAVLSGLAAGHSFIYSILSYVRQQTRIKTATEGFLDLISRDFFGGALPRKPNETDPAFLKRIQFNLLRERATRLGVVKALEELTGYAPQICEPQNPADCGAYGEPNWGYGAAGYYGSRLLPYQGFIQAYRPVASGIPKVGGYGVPASGLSGLGVLFDGIPVAPLKVYAPGGYGVGLLKYGSIDMIQGDVTDADIYETITSVIPDGTIAWVNISNP